MDNIEKLKQDVLDRLGNEDLSKLSEAGVREHIDTIKAAAAIPSPIHEPAPDNTRLVMLLLLLIIGISGPTTRTPDLSSLEHYDPTKMDFGIKGEA